jgi:preprotein translocase subunit SecG
MKEFLFFLSNFLDFWFLPLIIGLIISIVIEQVFRAQKKPPEIFTSMRVRKFLWRQNIILNFAWFICYFLLSFMLRTPQSQLPDMIWQG